MAGVETISAIIGIADFGLRLSGAISDYISSVKDANSGIKHTANDVKTTSERLNDIGNLIRHQTHSKLFSDEGLQSAHRSSGECKEVLNEIRYILCKNKFISDFSQFAKEDLDLSYFTKIKWPFIKSKLEIPRAELQRIKTDLVLLFTSVMAIGAVTQAEQRFYCMEIPKAEKIRQQAARKAEKAKKRAQRRDSLGHISRLSSRGSDKDDLSMEADFAAYKAQRAKEDVERRVKQQLAVLEAEEEARRQAAEEERLKIEAEGVQKYKERLRLQQEERQARVLATTEAFRTELLKQNFPLEQIQAILANMQLASNPNFEPALPVIPESNPTITSVLGSSSTGPQSNSKNSGLKLPWKRNKQNKSTPPFGLKINSSGLLHTSASSSWNGQISLETWVLDNSTFAWQIYSEDNSVLKRIDHSKSSQKLWETYSQLSTHFRGAFQGFYAGKTRETEGKYLWHILEIHPIKITRKQGFFRRLEEDIGLRVLMARKDMHPPSSQTPNDKEKADKEAPAAAEVAKPAVASAPSLMPAATNVDAKNKATTSGNVPVEAQKPDDDLYVRRRSTRSRPNYYYSSRGRGRSSSTDYSSTDDDMIYRRRSIRRSNRWSSDTESDLAKLKAERRRTDRLRDQRSRRERMDRHTQPFIRDDRPVRKETGTRGRQHESIWSSPAYRSRRDISSSPSPIRHRHGFEPPTLLPQDNRRQSTYGDTNYNIRSEGYRQIYPPARRRSMHRDRAATDNSTKPYVRLSEPPDTVVIEPVTMPTSYNKTQPQTYTETMEPLVTETSKRSVPHTYNRTHSRRQRSLSRSSLSSTQRSSSPPKTDTAIIVSMLNKFTSYKDSGLPPSMQLPSYAAPPATSAGMESTTGTNDNHESMSKALITRPKESKEGHGKSTVLDSADKGDDATSIIYESPKSIGRGRRKATVDDDSGGDSGLMERDVHGNKKYESSNYDRGARVSRGMTWARSMTEEKESSASRAQQDQSGHTATDDAGGVSREEGKGDRKDGPSRDII